MTVKKKNKIRPIVPKGLLSVASGETKETKVLVDRPRVLVKD